jgi:Bacterial cell division membrane protein
MSAPSVANLNRIGPRSRAGAPPVEYSLLLTATLCLVAFGIVMVFSASSTTSLLGTTGDSAYYLKRTLLFGGFGLLAMKALSGRGARAIRPLTPLLLAGSFFLLFMVLLPGFGISVNGASRWIGAGPVQVQPSELAKLALILYGAQLLAERPRMTGSLRTLAPYLVVVGFACVLIVAEPDLGTAMVVVFATTAMLVRVTLISSPPVSGRRSHGLQWFHRRIRARAPCVHSPFGVSSRA